MLYAEATEHSGSNHGGSNGSCSTTLNIDAGIAEAMLECLHMLCKQHGIEIDVELKHNAAKQSGDKPPAADSITETDPTQHQITSEGVAAEAVKPAVPQAMFEPTRLQPVKGSIPPAAAKPAAAKPIPKPNSTQLAAVMVAIAATAADTKCLPTQLVPLLARQLEWVDDRRRVRPGRNRVFKVSLPL